MASAFSNGLRVVGNRLNPMKKPLNPIVPPKMGIQPVVPPASPMTVPAQTVQPQIAPVTPQQPQNPSPHSSLVQDVLRRKRMLEI